MFILLPKIATYINTCYRYKYHNDCIRAWAHSTRSFCQKMFIMSICFMCVMLSEIHDNQFLTENNKTAVVFYLYHITTIPYSPQNVTKYFLRDNTIPPYNVYVVYINTLYIECCLRNVLIFLFSRFHGAVTIKMRAKLFYFHRNCIVCNTVE